MLEVRRLPEFTLWFDGLKDKTVRGAVLSRLRRLGMGLQGDAKSLGSGVLELRIHLGPGWRIYFTRRGTRLIVLLAGGSKGTQTKDIKRAKELAAELEQVEEGS
jgi:putative addiction module killer protein